MSHFKIYCTPVLLRTARDAAPSVGSYQLESRKLEINFCHSQLVTVNSSKQHELMVCVIKIKVLKEDLLSALELAAKWTPHVWKAMA